MLLFSKNTASDYALARYIAIALLTTALLRGVLVFTDPFHSGEFFASAVSFFNSNTTNTLPLTIHGALDFLPAVMARSVWGPENYFLPTLAIYKLFIFIAGIFFISITSSAIEQNKGNPWVIISIGLLSPFLLTYRDTFLFASLYAFLHLPNTKKTVAIHYFWQIVLGLSVAASMFWSYERGLACVIAIGFATLLLVLREKAYLISIATFIGAVLVAGNIHPALSLPFYLENIQFLVATSSQWNFGTKPSAIAIALLAIFINGFSLISYWQYIREEKNSKADIFQAVGLTALTLITLKTSMNRADLPHLYPALWMPIILLMLSTPKNQPYPKPILWLIYSLLLAGLAFCIKAESYTILLGMILITFLLKSSSTESRDFLDRKKLNFFIMLGFAVELFNIGAALTNGGYRWLNALHHPPSNFHATEESMQWVSKEILNSKSNCLFDLSNNGIINGLTGLPSCSRITYPAYATPKFEDEFINTLTRKPPNAIVYSSTYWSYSIDNKPMSEKFPKLNIFLVKNFPVEVCQFGYCIRKK